MIVFGAKGLAKQILHSLSEGQIKTVRFYDNVNDIHELHQCSVINEEELFKAAILKGEPFIIGVGGPKVRKHVFQLYEQHAIASSFISSKARVSPFANISDQGVVILQGSLAEPDVSIARGTLVNVDTVITHDSSIGEFCEIGPGAKLLGRCRIGNDVMIGAGAIILPDITIADGAVVGAGAVVTNNVPSGKKVVGVPAKSIQD